MRDRVRSATGFDQELETRQVTGSGVSGRGIGLVGVGGTLGRYVVVEEAGRGGMGRVLRAYDPKLQREVALKEVRDGALDAAATSRLIAEARAMAKLSHPNVVAVYDVETLERGRVVVVMEYVAGQTLRAWLGERDRGWAEIVRHFIAAGRGLAGAHEASLLHRDFKPTNVLVAANGVIKVTDFGLATGVHASSEGASFDSGTFSERLTRTGQVVGTPRYMAPEQHTGGPLTAAADQYSFCVALWEALCGEPPFTGKTIGTKKASGPPTWPDVRVPRAITDAVVRGLSPAPEDRWPSMHALLQALAWDPARRRRQWLLGGAGVLLVAVGGTSYRAWTQARQQPCGGAREQLAAVWDEDRRAQVHSAFATIEKSYADEAWDRTVQALDAYAEQWVGMHTEACEATTLRGEQSGHLMDLRMACLKRASVELRAVVDVLSDPDPAVVQQAHKVTAGLPPLSRCADAAALEAEVEPPSEDEAAVVEAAYTDLARATSLRAVGKYEAARRAVGAAKEALSDAVYGPVRTEVAAIEGGVLESLGDYDAAVVALEEALRLAARWRQYESMRRVIGSLMHIIGETQQHASEALRYLPLAEGLSQGDPAAQGRVHSHVGSILAAQGKYDEAEQEYRTALTLTVDALGADHISAAAVHNNLAVALYLRGRYAEAEGEYRAALRVWEAKLGADHPQIATSRTNLGSVLSAQGRYADAETEHRAALALSVAAVGPEHPGVAMSRNNLAGVLHAQGRYAEAEAELRTALSITEAALGPDHPEVATTLDNISIALRGQGKLEEAEAKARAALTRRVAALGPDHPDVASSHINLGAVLYDQGNYAEAEAEHRRALAVLQPVLGSDHPDVASLHNNLGGILFALGEYAQAEKEHRAALAGWEAVLGPDHPEVASAREGLAAVLVELDRLDEALPLAERAWAQRQGSEVPKGQKGDAAMLLARILWRIGAPARDRARARSLAEDASSSFAEAGDASGAKLREAKRWLHRHGHGR